VKTCQEGRITNAATRGREWRADDARTTRGHCANNADSARTVLERHCMNPCDERSDNDNAKQEGNVTVWERKYTSRERMETRKRKRKEGR